MSFSIDCNLLLYCSDEQSPFHQAALDFLRAKTADSDLLCLTWPVLFGYLRMATHRAIFAAPLQPKDALANIRALLALPRVRVFQEAEGFLDLYERLTAGFPVRGNLVPDAHLAVLLHQHGVRTLYTNDSDFQKFGFLDARNPFT